MGCGKKRREREKEKEKGQLYFSPPPEVEHKPPGPFDTFWTPHPKLGCPYFCQSSSSSSGLPTIKKRKGASRGVRKQGAQPLVIKKDPSAWFGGLYDLKEKYNCI